MTNGGLFQLTLQVDSDPQQFTQSILKKFVTFVAPPTNKEYIYIGDFCVKFQPNRLGVGYRLSPFWGVLNDAPNFTTRYMHNSKFWYVSGKKGDTLIGYIEEDPMNLMLKQLQTMTGKISSVEPVDF